jgi:hypothetical protein
VTGLPFIGWSGLLVKDLMIGLAIKMPQNLFVMKKKEILSLHTWTRLRKMS